MVQIYIKLFLRAKRLSFFLCIYRNAFPLFTGCCRFEPSCSNYMIEALQTHGAVKGLYLGMMRLLRCHPFGKSGYDPVPPRKS